MLLRLISLNFILFVLLTVFGYFFGFFNLFHKLDISQQTIPGDHELMLLDNGFYFLSDFPLALNSV